MPKSSAKISTHHQNSLKDSISRGAQSNVTGRYNHTQTQADLQDYGWLDNDQEKSALQTEFFEDHAQTIIAQNDSPDIGFTYSINPYRGCEHGCIYCYARPTHEYLSLSPGLDFESKIFVKYKAPELLRKKLLSKAWTGEVIFFSGVTDCYQPVERRLQITRKCLEVALEFRNPVAIITKNQLIRRDIDLLQEMASYHGVVVYLSITTLKPELARVMEPRTSTPQARLKAIEDLAKAGVPVGVNVAPIIPGLTDQEMPDILKAAAEVGAKWAGYTPVRLPSTVAPLFEEWLETHFPERKNKILNAVRSCRDGKLNDPAFGTRMQGTGPRADMLAELFHVFTKKNKLNLDRVSLSADSFRKPPALTPQLSFDL